MKKKDKKLKGYSIAEVLIISAVFLAVMTISLTILLRGWNIISSMENKTMHLRSAREAVARMSNYLREAEIIYYPDDIKKSRNTIIFAKSTGELLNPQKEVLGFKHIPGGKVNLLIYSPDYPDTDLILEEKLIARNIDHLNFELFNENKQGEEFETTMVQITLRSIDKSVEKNQPEIKLNALIKLK
ncbi:MAG: hypothetical protein ABIH00_02215 [Armatimonadota bacterium]